MLRSLFRRFTFNFASLNSDFLKCNGRNRHRSWTWVMLGVNCLRGTFIPSSLLGLRAAVVFDKKKGGKASNKADKMVEVTEVADRLYSEHEVEKLYDYLIQFKDSDDDEILWRLARATSDVSKITVDQEKQKQLVMDAFRYATKALQANDKNFATHKWYAILLDATAALEGTKARLLCAEQMLHHFKKASDLNPMDATTYYSIGLWYFSFADLAWYERKICSLVFETPPQSSYEMALWYFEKAEEVQPNFYSKNTLMLGKTHARMKEREKAIHHLKKVLTFNVEIPCDIEAQEEAIQLLRSLGVDV